MRGRARGRAELVRDRDAAAASLIADARDPATTDGIALRVQRHFETEFEPPIKVSDRRGPVTALDVALDYRSDALVVWEQGGSIWARVWRAGNGHLWPL